MGPRSPPPVTPASRTPWKARGRRRHRPKAAQPRTSQEGTQRAERPPPSPHPQIPGPAPRETSEGSQMRSPGRQTPPRGRTTAPGTPRPRGPRGARETPTARPRHPPSWSCWPGPPGPATCGTGRPPSARGSSASRRYSGTGTPGPRAGRPLSHLLCDRPAPRHGHQGDVSPVSISFPSCSPSRCIRNASPRHSGGCEASEDR